MLKRLMNSRKGVAEVIGSLILILIVSVAGVIVYAYSVNMIGSSSTDFNNQTTRNEELLKERVQILRIWLYNQNQMNITILNFGQTDFTPDAVYINGNAVTQFTSGKGETIAPNQIVKVTFTLPLTAQIGSSLDILVVSERGGKTTALFQA